MGMHVCMGATLQCSFGAAPSSLVVLPASCVVTGGVPAANIMDNKPIVNVLPFGTCNSMSDPGVAAAPPASNTSVRIRTPFSPAGKGESHPRSGPRTTGRTAAR